MTDRNHPRSEPEIIPPQRAGNGDRSGIWISVDENGDTRRIYVARPGPFTIILALAILGLIAAVVLIVLLSLALI